MELLEIILLIVLIVGGVCLMINYSPYVLGALALIGVLQLYYFFARPKQPRTQRTA